MATRREVGTVYKIRLNDGGMVYSVPVSNVFMTFLDGRDANIDRSALREVLELPKIFTLLVTQGEEERWEEIGRIEMKSGQVTIPDRYMQSLAHPEEMYRVDEGFNKVSATYEEVKELEAVVAWSASSIEDRLKAYFEGKKSKHWERTRPVKPDENKNFPKELPFGGSGKGQEMEVRLLANDDANEWLHEMSQMNDSVSWLEQTVDNFHQRVTAGEYIDQDFCNRVVAAGEVVAAAEGEPSGELPDFIVESLDMAAFNNIDGSTRARLVESLRMVGHGVNSELREVWEDYGKYYRIWQSKVDGLIDRLGG